MTYWTHNLDPVFFALGPLKVHWYGTMYLVGFVLGYYLLVYRWKTGKLALNPENIQALITYLMLFMILCARLGYVLVYDPWNYLENPGDIFAIWKGGLSYHGAAIGFMLACIFAAKQFQVSFFHIADNVVFGSALGVIFGRIGNFINGELAGRITDVPWAVIFPVAGPEPRHPSQLYQALGEGLCLFIILILLEKWEAKKGYAPSYKQLALKANQKKKTSPKKKKAKKPESVMVEWSRSGILCGAYIMGYGVIRFIVEFFRQPDAQLGFFAHYFSMGQILCTLMIMIGGFLIWYRIKYPLPIKYKWVLK